MIQPLKLFSLQTIKPNNRITNINVAQSLPSLRFATKSDTFERTTNPIQSTAISFTGFPNDEKVRALGNIECPCCGIKMLTTDNMKEISSKVNGSNAKAIEVLDKYEEYMHPVEKECYHLIKEWNVQDPELNFKKLLQKHKDSHLKDLQTKQNNILDNVNNYAKKLPLEEQTVINSVVDKTRDLVASNDKEIKFKRKTFIKTLQDNAGKISDKKVLKEIMDEAEKMPTSHNDVNAFIVKYSERSHREIGERLLKLSVGTIEHIKPRSEGGGNAESNYLLECGGCNHIRSSISLSDWVDMHPEMIKNTQAYIDTVIDRINNGSIKDFHFYPAEVAKTLFKESNGKINLNIDKLK